MRLSIPQDAWPPKLLERFPFGWEYNHTMLKRPAFESLCGLIYTISDERVPGDLLEAGCNGGGCVAFMRGAADVFGLWDRDVYGCDSFEGIPTRSDQAYPYPGRIANEAAPGEIGPVGMFACSEERCRQVLNELGGTIGIKLVRGWFKDTLSKLPIEKLSLLRIDGDIYSSYLETLRRLYSKVVDGGFVVLDEYTPPETPSSVGIAVHEFLKEIGEKVLIRDSVTGKVVVDENGALLVNEPIAITFWRKGER